MLGKGDGEGGRRTDKLFTRPHERVDRGEIDLCGMLAEIVPEDVIDGLSVFLDGISELLELLDSVAHRHAETILMGLSDRLVGL